MDRAAGLVLLSLLGGVGCGGDASPEANQVMEAGALLGITAAHNEARASVNPAAKTPLPPLVWSPQIASVAQAWADRCDFSHSNGNYGENLFAGGGQYTAQAVVDTWVSEKKNFNYASNGCTGVCGHYTQVVWAKSTQLGCGVATCTKNNPFGGGNWTIWVCNYDPPGNYIGELPY